MRQDRLQAIRLHDLYINHLAGSVRSYVVSFLLSDQGSLVPNRLSYGLKGAEVRCQHRGPPSPFFVNTRRTKGTPNNQQLHRPTQQTTVMGAVSWRHGAFKACRRLPILVMRYPPGWVLGHLSTMISPQSPCSLRQICPCPVESFL